MSALEMPQIEPTAGYPTPSTNITCSSSQRPVSPSAGHPKCGDVVVLLLAFLPCPISLTARSTSCNRSCELPT